VTPDDQARLAQGLAAMLLVAVLLGGLFAFLTMRLAAGPYVAFLVPAACAWAIGAGVGALGARLGVRQRREVALIAGLGALLLSGGYHVLVYLRVTGHLAEEIGPEALERLAGEGGVVGYLRLVSQGVGAELSPLGLLGSLEPGVVGTVALALAEAALAVTVAVVVALRKLDRGGDAPEPLAAGRVREAIARTDTETLLAAMQAMDRGDFESAGRVLRRPATREAHEVVLEFVPDSDAPFTLEIVDLRPGGHRVRARRELASWDGHALWDELRIRR
jgi:hypothetical protein